MTYLKKEISPEQTIHFAGFILKTTGKTFEQIINYILTETDAELIYQTHSVSYLFITDSQPEGRKPPTHKTPPQDSIGTLYSTPQETTHIVRHNKG
jgi:hypothetical protein